MFYLNENAKKEPEKRYAGICCHEIKCKACFQCFQF